MLAWVGGLAVNLLALLSAVQLCGCQLARDAGLQAVGSAGDLVGKGATRCLRTAVTMLGGGAGAEQTVLGYSHAAAAGIAATVTTAFHNKSYWTAVAMLDLSALWAVLCKHKSSHAEAAAAASVRRAAADPADAATSVQEPASQNLPLLQCAAMHSKAAYGAPAANGYLSSAAGYISLLTIGQATRKAPRHIPASQHITGVQQLTGCKPGDILTAQWQSHLHRPAFYAAIDRQRQCVVVAVRGTMQLGDYCTVLDAVPQPVTLFGVSGHAHAGFLAAARNLLPVVTAALESAACTCPGWPVLVTGHSLGGGVAAVLSMLLIEQRRQEGQGDDMSGLGEIRCVGIGTAAAFCQRLGTVCKQHVTSVLYGADCVPMFSVLGARLLIEEVHQTSRAAAAVGSVLRRARSSSRSNTATHARSISYGGSSARGSAAAHSRSASLGGGSEAGSSSLGRTSSGASLASSMSCELACGSNGCRGLCASTAVADSAAELLEIEEADMAGATATGGIGPGPRLHRSCSLWSNASTSSASLAAFAADCFSRQGASGGGEALVPMFPPGRILWLLPADPASAKAPSPQQQRWRHWLLQHLGGGSRQQQQESGKQRPTMVETDQSAFERFLLTLDTAAHHLPDCYQDALASLAS